MTDRSAVKDLRRSIDAVLTLQEIDMKYLAIALLLAGCASTPQEAALQARQSEEVLRHIDRMYPPQPIYRNVPQQNTIINCRRITPDWVQCQWTFCLPGPADMLAVHWCRSCAQQDMMSMAAMWNGSTSLRHIRHSVMCERSSAWMALTQSSISLLSAMIPAFHTIRGCHGKHLV